jgi:LCP family protein required for cell wall assembly
LRAGRPASWFARSLDLARTRTRYAAEGEEVARWREGLEKALRTKVRRRRPLRVIAMGLVLIVVAGVAAGYAYWRVINGLFTRTNVALEAAAGGVLNILLVGSDSRQGLDDPLDVQRFGSVGGKRADTIILAQIVPREQRGVLLHLPRDLYVTVHGSGQQSNAKINSAYNFGPQGVIDTVGSLTRLPINHYMEIDIRGFRQMVDAIGGIDVCVNETNFYDSKLNFRLPQGTSHLDGNSALSYVRARHATPDGDFGRIKRQQQFIRAVMGKIGNPSVLGNPARVNDLARSFASNITVDQTFQFDDLVRFALSIRRVGPDQLLTYSVPAHSGRVGGQSVVLIDTQQAEVLFSALRNGADPSQVIPTTQAAPEPGGQARGLGAQAGPCAPAV